MVVSIINKILMLLFVLSILNVIRHLYYIGQAFIMSNDSEIKYKYKLSKVSLILLGLSLAYIISSIILGIKI